MLNSVRNCNILLTEVDMQRLTEQIMSETKSLPEGMPLSAKSLLHLGSRAAVDQTLSRLVHRGQLLRAGRGLYVTPVVSRFGKRAPAVEAVIENLADVRGETIVPSEASSANALGLTTQVPTKAVYLTSGRPRTLALGKQTVQLRHVRPWKLTLAHEPAGQIVRALSWAGPAHVESAANTIRTKVPNEEFRKVVRHAAKLPSWMAKAVGRIANNG
ncbi:MAG: hypothetical protein JWM43_2701 [Acidobacteriaceae bacterium]|nr:hypothetical protein [Acidobacteriaceae bacterium]